MKGQGDGFIFGRGLSIGPASANGILRSENGRQEPAGVLDDAGQDVALAKDRRDTVLQHVVDPGLDAVDFRLRVDKDADFKVNEEATEVEIGRAEHRHAVIDDDGLGVEHPRGVLEHAPAGPCKLPREIAPGEIRDGMVRLERHDQRHVAARARTHDHGAQEHIVRDEIGGDDPDVAHGLLDHGDNSLIEGVAGNIRAARHHLELARAPVGGPARLSVLPDSVGGLLYGEAPVRDEHLAQDDRSGSPDHGAKVAPALGVGGRAHVLPGNVPAAHDCGHAIKNGHLSVAPEIGGASGRKRHDRHESTDLAPGLPDGIDKAPRTEEAAERVQEQPDLYPLARALGQQFHDPAARRIAAQDEARDVNRVLRGQDLALKLREILLAGQKVTDPVSPDRLEAAGPRHRLRHGFKDVVRLGDAHLGKDWEQGLLSLHHAFQLSPPYEKVERNTEPGDENDHEQPREGVGGRAPLAHQPGDQEKSQEEAGDRRKVRQEPAGHKPVNKLAELTHSSER